MGWRWRLWTERQVSARRGREVCRTAAARLLPPVQPTNVPRELPVCLRQPGICLSPKGGLDEAHLVAAERGSPSARSPARARTCSRAAGAWARGARSSRVARPGRGGCSCRVTSERAGRWRGSNRRGQRLLAERELARRHSTRSCTCALGLPSEPHVLLDMHHSSSVTILRRWSQEATPSFARWAPSLAALSSQVCGAAAHLVPVSTGAFRKSKS